MLWFEEILAAGRKGGNIISAAYECFVNGKLCPNHEWFMKENLLYQRVQFVLKFVSTELFLHINGANVTLPHTNVQFVYPDYLCPTHTYTPDLLRFSPLVLSQIEACFPRHRDP